MHQLRDRLTYSNVMATVAVFVALGGTSYAAIKLPRNSVGSNQIKSSAVSTSEVKDRSLATRDLSLAARGSSRARRVSGVRRGRRARSGPSTARVVVKTNVVYKTNSSSVAAEVTSQLTVQCDPRQKVIGGGVRKDTGTDVSLRESYPSNNNTAWSVRVGNDDVAPAPGVHGDRRVHPIGATSAREGARMITLPLQHGGSLAVLLDARGAVLGRAARPPRRRRVPGVHALRQTVFSHPTQIDSRCCR